MSCWIERSAAFVHPLGPETAGRRQEQADTPNSQGWQVDSHNAVSSGASRESKESNHLIGTHRLALGRVRAVTAAAAQHGITACWQALVHGRHGGWRCSLARKVHLHGIRTCLWFSTLDPTTWLVLRAAATTYTG